MLTLPSRIGPNKHIDRWYLVAITRDLCDPIAVLRSWGNRRNSCQHVRVQPMPDVGSAATETAEIVANKVRGHVMVASHCGLS